MLMSFACLYYQLSVFVHASFIESRKLELVHKIIDVICHSRERQFDVVTQNMLYLENINSYFNSLF